jgi:hypothetical protein
MSCLQFRRANYRVFADIVHESGYTQTLVTSVVLPRRSIVPTPDADPDDSYCLGLVSQNSRVVRLLDGATIEWLNDGVPIIAGKPAPMRFLVRNPDGTDASLEPYLGMAGHAVVEREDGSVFVHLHPMGTISMASQMAFTMRQPGDTVRGQLGKRVSEAELSQMKDASVASNIVSFPYAFPTPGDYRIWVQVSGTEKCKPLRMRCTFRRRRKPTRRLPRRIGGDCVPVTHA